MKKKSDGYISIWDIIVYSSMKKHAVNGKIDVHKAKQILMSVQLKYEYCVPIIAQMMRRYGLIVHKKRWGQYLELSDSKIDKILDDNSKLAKHVRRK